MIELSAVQRRDRDRLLPALEALSVYLTAGSWPTFAQGVQHGGTVRLFNGCRTRPLYPAIVVNPRFALDWARRHGRTADAYTGAPLRLDDLVSALEWMGAVAATTFRPEVDDKGVRRRAGWWRLPSPVHQRFRERFYVPAPGHHRGRPPGPRHPLPVTEATPARRDAVLAEPALVALVLHWVSVCEPTALMGLAEAQDRPLVTLRRGRRGDDPFQGRPLLLDRVCGTADALSRHADRHAGSALPFATTVAEIEAALGVRARRTAYLADPPVSAMTRCSTFDAGARQHLRGWWRFTLRGLGLPDVDGLAVAAEVRDWRADVVPRPRTRRELDTELMENDPAMREVLGLPPLGVST